MLPSNVMVNALNLVVELNIRYTLGAGELMIQEGCSIGNGE